MQDLDKLVNVCTHDLDARLICAANFISDLRLITSTLQQFNYFGGHNIQTKNLTVAEVEEDFSIFRSCHPNCV